MNFKAQNRENSHMSLVSWKRQ